MYDLVEPLARVGKHGGKAHDGLIGNCAQRTTVAKMIG
jgi:hypothetical protein